MIKRIGILDEVSFQGNRMCVHTATYVQHYPYSYLYLLIEGSIHSGKSTLLEVRLYMCVCMQVYIYVALLTVHVSSDPPI